MFVNLYGSLCSGSTFSDHNYSYFMERLEKVPESRIVEQIRERYRTDFWDPELAAVFEFTLSERVCESFLRTYSDVPMLPRDFYLSKLLQFLLLSLREALARIDAVDPSSIHNSIHNLYAIVEDALDRIPDSVTPHLHVFNWFYFQRDVRDAIGQYPDLQPLHAVLGSLWEAYLTTQVESDSMDQPIEQLAEQRNGLLAACLNLTGARAADVYKHAKVAVDYADFKRWRKGELPASSKMARRIEAFLTTEIKARGH